MTYLAQDCLIKVLIEILYSFILIIFIVFTILLSPSIFVDFFLSMSSPMSRFIFYYLYDLSFHIDINISETGNR